MQKRENVTQKAILAVFGAVGLFLILIGALVGTPKSNNLELSPAIIRAAPITSAQEQPSCSWTKSIPINIQYYPVYPLDVPNEAIPGEVEEGNYNGMCSVGCFNQFETMQENLIANALDECQSRTPPAFTCESPCSKFINGPVCKVTHDLTHGWALSWDQNVVHCSCGLEVVVDGTIWYGCAPPL